VVEAVSIGHDAREKALLDSRMQRVLAAVNVLSPELRDLFTRIFLRGETDEAASCELGLSPPEYQDRHQNLMRSLTRLLPPPPTSSQEVSS
jgi:hypothetical protein